jgi:predicted ATP-dependent endonuclease of OLD family
MEQEASAYITSVHLKGYKSIRDVSVTLNKGLNILIGANGSGKTNFLEFLDAVSSNYGNLFNGQYRKIEGKITGKKIEIEFLGERYKSPQMKNVAYKIEEKENNSTLTYYYDENKNHLQTVRDHDSVLSKSSQLTFSFGSTIPILLLRFENPLTQTLKDKINLNLSFSENGNESENWFYVDASLITNKAPYTFLNRVFSDFAITKEGNIDVGHIINEIVENRWFPVDDLKQNLKQFSPIKDFKINWTLTRQTKEEYDDIILIEGIDFQFYVNNEWINWTQLSDGTKRLFYLIGSVTYATENEIILIEEPELGVHPHQLALLMNFLKSESEDKQIIISTHSPQVLNCLKGEELDRIIVARHEGKAGTKLYHLSEEEKGYASAYMVNEAFLSDYWMLSGFMNEEPTENA